ncbi:MAG: hypothetical protein M3P34_00525 [Actinomycetota bacterium]|nr:hypothetical protein [Actinomycetota bacterium]
MQYVFPSCSILVDNHAQYVETRFGDGTKVGSTPNRDDHSLRVAAGLGYGDDTWSMSRDHELAHTWLAHLAGLPWSPTMWRLAHPWDPDLPDDAAVAHEEATVLRFQGTLDKTGLRPWDLADVPAKAPLRW